MIQYNEELFDKDLKNQDEKKDVDNKRKSLMTDYSSDKDEKDYHISVLDKDNEYLDNEDFHKE